MKNKLLENMYHILEDTTSSCDKQELDSLEAKKRIDKKQESSKEELEFFQKVLHNDIEGVKKELEKNKQYINLRTPNKDTPLHFAAYAGNTRMVKLFLKYKPAFYNNNDEELALDVAKRRGHPEIVKLLQSYWDKLLDEKKEQVASASLGDVFNAGSDKEKTSEKEHDTFKVTFGDNDEGKLLGQVEALNKLKKEQGWMITVSPILSTEDEGDFKYVFIYSYDTPMSDIKSKLNNGASIEKWEDKKESINNILKQVSSNPAKCKAIVENFMKKRYLSRESFNSDTPTIAQNNLVDRAPDSFESFHQEQKVIVINGKYRGCTGVVKVLMEPNIFVLLETYRTYMFNYQDLRIFSNTKSREIQ